MHCERQIRGWSTATRERKPPFSPDACVEEFCELLKLYGVSKVIGDRYGGQWPRERFRAHGAQYEPSERSKSEIYASLLPLLNSQRVELLDDRRLRTQLLGLERRTSRGGRDSIDHATGSHDDLVNSVAGAIVMAAARQITRTPVPIVRSTPILTYQSWVEEEFAEFARSLREKRNRR